jgi:hypothetical protein
MALARGQATLGVVGYRELLRACNRGDKETKKYTRDTLRHVGDIVREDATRRFSIVARSRRPATKPGSGSKG